MHRTREGVRIIAAPLATVAGRVTGADDRPLESALVQVSLESAETDSTSDCTWITTSNADGTFALDRCPQGAGIVLSATAQGHERASLPLGRSARDLHVALHPVRSVAVKGLVVDPTGGPVAGAVVRLGASRGTSQEDGAFELTGAADEADPLVVTAEGYGPAHCANWANALEGALVVRMGAPLAIRGRLSNEDGTACAGWCVALEDPTPLRADDGDAPSVEHLLDEARVVTDADGRFSMSGVLDRPYRLVAWEGAGRAAARWKNVAPSHRDIELLVQPASTGRTITGTVVDDLGQPVANAAIGEARHGWQALEGRHGMCFDRRTHTDRDGHFELELSPAALALIVDGDAIVPQRHLLAADAPSVTVGVRRRMDLRILADPAVLAEVGCAAGPRGSVTPEYGEMHEGALWVGLAVDTNGIALRRGGRTVGQLHLPPGAGAVDLIWR